MIRDICWQLWRSFVKESAVPSGRGYHWFNAEWGQSRMSPFLSLYTSCTRSLRNFHPSLQTNKQEVPVLKVSVMSESGNGICYMEVQNQRAIMKTLGIEYSWWYQKDFCFMWNWIKWYFSNSYFWHDSYCIGFIYTDACLGSCLSFCSGLSPCDVFLKGNISSWSMVRVYVECVGNWRVCCIYKVLYVF